MHRFRAFWLTLAVVLAVPMTAWEASVSQNLAVNVTQGQAITAVTLSNNSFTGGAPSGTVVGAISVTMSPTSPAFSGSLSLSGTNASQFQISGGNLTTNGVVVAGTYQLNIVATQSGVGGSPFMQAEAITGTNAAPLPPPSGAEKPGPSQALFNSPYYTCVRNFYVATNGNDSNTGTSPSTAWRTIKHADTSSRTGGDCINIAPGIYASANQALAHGGTTASSTGYVVYRCTTMNACTITDNYKPFCAGAPCGGSYPSYLIFDGFTFNSPTPTQAFAYAIGCDAGDSRTAGCHHWWIVNNIIKNYGQSGVQMNNGEYFYTIHNIFSGNSHSCTAAQGSGISYVALRPIASYTPTPDDTNANNNSALNSMGIIGPNFPFRNTVGWNVAYNNYGCTTNAGGNSDGNGIIMDSFSTSNNNTVEYTNRTLVEFNIAYNNGGGGVHNFMSGYVTVANNSVYNNYLDTNNNATSRPNLDQYYSYAGVGVNNISVACVNSSGPNGSGNTQGNQAIGSAPNNSSQAHNTWNNNITLMVNSFCGSNIGLANGDTYSFTANKQATNPLWADVGRTSAGTVSTQPAGANFALCTAAGVPNASCTGASPAIGYGATQSYLPSQSVDAGACYHTLTSCP